MSLLETTKVVPCKRSNYGGKRAASAIKYLVYHYTGNDGDRAANNALYYQNTTVQASAHYFVDDDNVYLSVDPLYVAWAVGGDKWRDCPQTGGGKAYGIVRNANSISIEMCDTSRDGQLMATEATLARAVQLGREIMAKYGIPIENVVRHFDVTGKHCPAYFMDETVWAAFKARLAEKGSEDMKVYHYVAEMPEWAQAAATRAIRSGHMKMDAGGAVSVYEPNLQALVWMDRAGMFDKPPIHTE